MNISSRLNLFFRRHASLLSPNNPLRKATAKLWDVFLSGSKTNVTLPLQNQDISLGPMWRSLSPDYEHEALQSFLHAISPGQVVWDIGAHIGLYSVLSANQVGQKGKIVCWEPSPDSFKHLIYHLKINNVSGHCTPINAAMNDGSKQEIEFILNDKTKFSIYNRMVFDKAEPNQKTAVVPACSLDEWVEKLDHTPDIVKMDIEGAEIMVLRHGQKLLGGNKKPSILLSIHPGFVSHYDSSLDELYRIAHENGYFFQDLNGHEVSNPQEHAEYWMLPRN